MTLERIPLCQPIESRTNSLNQDSKSSNCYFETREGRKDNIKRPGRTTVTLTGSPPTNKAAQGLYAWNNYLYAVVNNTVYKISSSNVSSSIGSISGTATNNVSWKETATVPWLTIHNDSNFYIVSTAGSMYNTFSQVAAALPSGAGSGYVVGDVLAVVGGGVGEAATLQVTSIGSGGSVTGLSVVTPGNYYSMPAMPAATSATTGSGLGCTVNLSAAIAFFPSGPYAKGTVYLDGYIFIATQAGRIYNSSIENPVGWNALNYISAAAEPDPIVGIAKHFNYLVAFGTYSTEFFYDAGNATGSPLAKYDSARLEIGCIAGSSIVEMEQTLMWVGAAKGHGKSVYMLDGLSPTRVSDQYIEKYLNADNTDNFVAYAYKIAGHTFYILTLRSSDLTFVYDLNEKAWYHWSTATAATTAIVGLAIAGIAVAGSSGDAPKEHYYRPVFYTEFNNGYYLIDDVTGSIYIADTNVYLDSGDPIYWRVVTPRIDNGSTNRKFINRLEVVGDKVNATIQVRHSDDDYNTFSAWRQNNLNSDRVKFFQLGSTRRRSYEFLCLDNVPLRLGSAEIDFDIGYLEGGQG